MKANKILLFTLASAMFAGCSNDEWQSNEYAEGLKNGKLVSSGLLSMSVGAEAGTRALSPLGNFVWMPESVDESGNILENSNQKIGLCWTGRNIDEPGYGVITTEDALTANVYSNVKFEHVGWLDVNATKPSGVECAEETLANGAYIVGEGTPAAAFSGSLTGSRYNKYYTEDKRATGAKGAYTKTEHEESTGVLNLGKGLFKTENTSVFAGEYLAYYPYTDKFTKGSIIAEEPVEFNINVDGDAYAATSKYGFAIGYIRQYNGGMEASKVSSRTLSGFFGVKLTNSDNIQTNNIKTVIFYSPKTGIVYSQELNTKACVAALKGLDAEGQSASSADLGSGSSLFVGEGLTKNSVFVNLEEGENKYATVSKDETETVVIPVLPQTIDDLMIVLVNDNDQTYTITSGAIADNVKTIQPNEASIHNIDLKDVVFKNEYMVVDEASFISAMAKIYASGSTSAVNTIQLLNDVRLESVNKENYGNLNYIGNFQTLFFNKDINIVSDFGATLTIAEGQHINIKSDNNDAKLDIDVDVIIEGMGCCGSEVGKLAIGGKVEKIVKVDMEKVVNNGALLLGNVQGDGSGAVINITTLENKFDEYAISKQKTADAACLFLLGGTATDVTIGTLNNNGNILSKAITLDVAADTELMNFQATAPAYAGLDSRIINTKVTTLVNETSENKGGKISIEGNTEMYVENLTNKSTDALIITKNIKDNEASDLDGRLSVTGNSTNNGIIDNNGIVNWNKHSMENKGLFIDQLSGQVGGYPVINGQGDGNEMTYEGVIYATDLKVKGIYVSKVASIERLNFALTDAVEEPSTNVVEILDMDKNAKFYDLSKVDPNNKLQGKDVYVAAGEKTILFKALGADNKGEEKYFGHCVTVRSNSSLNVKDGVLKTKSDVNVEVGAEFIADVKYTAEKSEVEIGGNLNNEGTTNHKANKMTVTENLNNATEAEFISAQTFNVVGNVLTSGTFDSNGTLNTVGGNFTQKAGEVTFACQTTTDIAGQFSCEDGTFTREALGTSTSYRATVNVGSLGVLTGTNNGGWPTVKIQ